MKRRLLLLLLPLLLSGCERLIAQEYVTVTPHAEQPVVEEDGNAMTAQNYLSLRNAILSFVQNGVEHGVIRTRDYSGSVEEDLAAAAYEVVKLDPLGAYAVDYMTHDCAQIVSYYEIHIEITFRRTAEQIRAIRRAYSATELTELLNQALAEYAPELTLRLSYYTGQDLEALAREYYDTNPASAMALPRMTVNVYPESGNVRILELLFDYDESTEALLEKADAVATSVRAAGEYVRYRRSESEKLQLLYTYLQERFNYRFKEDGTPVYAFLCEGVAGDDGCARSLQVLCDQIGLECYTVSGNRSGEPYLWNILRVEDRFCHVDLLRALVDEEEMLPLYADEELLDYYWDTGRYPACPPEEEEEPEALEEAEEPGEPAAEGGEAAPPPLAEEPGPPVQAEEAPPAAEAPEPEPEEPETENEEESDAGEDV